MDGVSKSLRLPREKHFEPTESGCMLMTAAVASIYRFVKVFWESWP